MPESNLHKLSALGQSVWIDYLSRQILQSGKLAKMMEEDAVVGVTSNPTIFQKAISEGNAYDEQLKEILDSGEEDPKEIFLQLTSRDISRRLRSSAQGLGRGRRPRRLRLLGGRPEPRVRPRRDDRAGPPAPRVDRQAEPVREDSGDRAGSRCDRRDDRVGEEHQRHVDLLARPPPGSDGGLHPRPRAARRERRRPESGALRRELLRLARRHRSRQAPRAKSAATLRSSRASSGSRTQSWRTRTTSRPSAANAGRRSRRRARRSSAASGRPRRRRTRTTETLCTSRSCSAPTP